MALRTAPRVSENLQVIPRNDQDGSPYVTVKMALQVRPRSVQIVALQVRPRNDQDDAPQVRPRNDQDDALQVRPCNDQDDAPGEAVQRSG